MIAVLTGTMLAGCGGSSSDEGGANKLSIMCWMNENDFGPVLEGFKKAHPDIEVDFQNVPNEGNQYQQKLNLLANSEELPDVYWINSPIDNFAKNGYMKDNLYKKYNFEAPKNWDEFLTQAETFMKDGIKPIAMAGAQLNDLVVWLHNTEDVAKDNTLDDQMNVGEKSYSDVYKDVLDKWYEDCVESGIITQDMIGITDEQRLDEFASGKAAATLTGAWAISGIMEKNPNMNMGIIPYVGTEGNEYTMGAVNIGIAINSKAKNEANAEAFLNYMGSEEGMREYQKMQDSFLGADIDYEVNPIMEPMKKYAENGQFFFPSYNWTYTDSMEPIIQKGLQEIVMGTKTVKELTDEMDEKLEILIESNK